jgi:hypothetical protein
MSDKELLRAIGLDDRTIEIGLNDEYAQMMLEKKIDNYLKKLDEEKKKEQLIEQLKNGHDDFKERQHLIEMLKSNIVYNVIKDMLIKDGFSYRCPTCVDLSGQYGRAIQNYPKYNQSK